MKYALIALLFFPHLLTSQTEKGLSPVKTAAKTKSLTTWAVVVGISDYQDDKIPDLRFADKDAEAFANFLRSPAGGSLDGDHLKVLINKDATAAQFAIALDWLMENSKEGDQAIIYFSGHGDVEKRTLTQPGFLLCWDAPARVYMAGGAFNLRDVQEIVSTLSIQNKSKVVVITDACRSGTLAGNSIGGAQATAANLAKQYANEIKILSCQPNEYSIEGEQWGGGRGAFSYNLVDALYGFADGNNDLYVTLQEVGRYLEDHVTAEVAPVSQVPMIIGNRMDRLVSVDTRLLADLRAGKTSQMKLLTLIEARGIEDEVLATVDSSIRVTYKLFKQALNDKIFLSPEGACADAYYLSLKAEPKLARLHSTLRRNYAAALQDDAQQVLNTLLKSGLTGEVLKAAKASQLYTKYPQYLQRAAELLGKDHYMFSILQARKHFFEGKMAVSAADKQAAFHQALKWQSNMPHALAELINTFSATQEDSANYYFNKATGQLPGWIVPHIRLASYLRDTIHQLNKAEEILNRAGQIDSNSVLLAFVKGILYQAQKNFVAAEYWLKKAIEGSSSDICFPCAYNNLATLYSSLNRDSENELALKKAIQLDSNFARAYGNLGYLYKKTNRLPEALAAYEKAVQLDSTIVGFVYNLGEIYASMQRLTEAEIAYKKAIQLDPSSSNYFQLGFFYSEYLHNYAAAEANYKKGIQIDSTNGKYFYNLGTFYNQIGKFEEAEAAYKKAIQLNFKQVQVYINLGNVYWALDRTEEKEAAYKNAIRADSSFAMAYHNLALSYAGRGLHDDAEALYIKSIQLDSNFYSSYVNLGSLYCEKMKRYEEAELLFKKVFPLIPNDVYLNFSIGYLYFKTGRYMEAEKMYMNTIQLDTSFPLTYYGLGHLFVETNRDNEAQLMLKKALVLDSTLTDAWMVLGKLHQKARRFNEAKSVYNRVIQLDSNFVDAYYNLACVQSRQGFIDDAYQKLEQALIKGYANYKEMQKDSDLSELREQSSRWKSMMKKYFPEKIKNE